MDSSKRPSNMYGGYIKWPLYMLGINRCHAEWYNIISIEALQKYEKNPQSLVKKADFNTNLTISSSFERSPGHFWR